MINKILFTYMLVFSLCTFSNVVPRAKTLYMKDTDVAHINIILGRSTILSFPTRPRKVVLGNKNHFAVEYIDNDLAISALHSQSKCNLVVYLQGRRFSFDLQASSSTGDEILTIRDALLKKAPKKKK